MKKTNWGIMGPGNIAHKFAESLRNMETAELTAVGSRDADRAKKFAEKYGAKRYYGNYKEFLMDPDIEIVYIATTHTSHFECAMMCLEAGKGVLCEKPFTINAGQARKLVNTARGKNIFMMEAMWTRYLPAIAKIRELLASGVLGDIRMIKADFGYRGDMKSEGRTLNLALGGGALLDVGIYPLSFTTMILGTEPEKVTGLACLNPTGADEQCTFSLYYGGGELAVLSAAVGTNIPTDAYILGTKGFIRIPEFWHASSFELNINGERQLFNLPYISTGYAHEALAAMECLAGGKLESPVMPLDETIRLMEIMDDIRLQLGVKYREDMV